MITDERILDLEGRLKRRRKPDIEERRSLQIIARLRATDEYIEKIRATHAEGNLLDLALLLAHEIPESGKVRP